MGNLLSWFPSSFTYDVCLVFCGDDLHDSFPRNLLKALNERGIRTFIDKNQESTLKAIEESRTVIIIFAEDICGLPLDFYSIDRYGEHAIITPVLINTNPSQVAEAAYGFYDPYNPEEHPSPYDEYFEVDCYHRCCYTAEKPGWYFKDGYLPDH
ncbi:putative TIR domain-containing protein [Medicago truncatula]|uniref:Disease resistance protein (TIR-NBS-LRR class) n=1 Tax=Medicago truncatula TaxID=3880 RepID=G7KKT2_MEDTR|nr:disease resistance protein RUN1 [Medicago truncatula]AES76428.1 disease resistance protein (TIR-NBS-LRR class) [Medicago truncatula]RHN52588.1 putative TIR domain-containing protein [Medicago truncatula]